MRLLRSVVLLALGVMGGFMAAAVAVKRAVPSRGDAESDEVALVAVFDGKQLRSKASAFRGGSMLAWFGGIEADLREATLAPDARISVAALFGGVALRVPPGWRVRSTVRAIAGGVEVSGTDPEDPEAPLLELDGFAFSGGVAVSRKPSEDDGEEP
ncbi:MAG TPA: LiaF domain-containing protein [Gaiellaceae bacterium]|nr:LiaF domain-containing protein [Gaiellaceae bacterium]